MTEDLRDQGERISENRVARLGSLRRSATGAVLTDITYIKTHEGWLYLCVIIDLFSRRVVGWSAQSGMTTELARQALLMTVWPRKPNGKVTVHSG
ncbi:hypothetical protein POI8812_03455 [Pontivivens insulae]|uniref:Integrase catalytic domain-containing protein n=1 Tax=Pontivivens insulae TaxID=1639689 RepID=A0A2R8AFT1_9RHOB|nr:hypothetical protein POI8812_03455 [Pontivivens insulae]